jgi:hypothetical protein
MNYFQHRYLTLIGHVQSGKTNEEIQYCYNSVKHLNTPVIFLTRNIKADQLQLLDRFQQYKFEYPIKILHTIDSDTALSILDSVGVLILLCNHHQLTKINDILKNYYGIYNVCIDEVDFSIKKRNSPIDRLITELKNKAHHILGATATPIAVFTREKVSIVKKMEPNKNYHSFETLHIQHIVPCIRKLDPFFPRCDHETIETIYNTLLQKDHCMLLHSVVYEKHLMYRIQEYISDVFPTFTVLVYNGDGIKVICNSRKSDVPFADTKEMNRYNQLVLRYFKVKSGNNTFHYFKNYSISEVLQILVDDPYHKHTHISIVAGLLASRGISFVSSDYSLHLTDQYVYKSGYAHGENILQSLRILGCYKDTVPLTLWCSKGLLGAIIEQNKIVHNLVDGLQNNTNWMCKMQTICISSKPNNPLTRPTLFKLQKQKEKGYYLDIETENENENEFVVPM